MKPEGRVKEVAKEAVQSTPMAEIIDGIVMPVAIQLAKHYISFVPLVSRHLTNVSDRLEIFNEERKRRNKQLPLVSFGSNFLTPSAWRFDHYLLGYVGEWDRNLEYCSVCNGVYWYDNVRTVRL